MASFKQIWGLATGFYENLQYQILKEICQVGAAIRHAYERKKGTDGHDEGNRRFSWPCEGAWNGYKCVVFYGCHVYLKFETFCVRYALRANRVLGDFSLQPRSRRAQVSTQRFEATFHMPCRVHAAPLPCSNMPLCKPLLKTTAQHDMTCVN